MIITVKASAFMVDDLCYQKRTPRTDYLLFLSDLPQDIRDKVWDNVFWPDEIHIDAGKNVAADHKFFFIRSLDGIKAEYEFNDGTEKSTLTFYYDKSALSN